MHKLIRRKNRLWTRYMQNKDILKYNEYYKCRNKVRSITHKAKKKSELQVAKKHPGNPKTFGITRI